MDTLVELKTVLSERTDLAFAVLVGSRASGKALAGSDWDIAFQWASPVDWMADLGAQESLRREIARALGVGEDRVDLIELSRANLTMRANVAENGTLLKGEDTLNWMHFLTRTWRELEYFYWEQAHAA